HGRRVFTFGVGEDVNAPLLDRVAEISRATTTYVLPGEDVEVKVADVFKRLYGPVLADGKLHSGERFSVAQYAPLRELIPGTVPDLFDGDQFVLLGQYRGEHPIHMVLQGNYLGKKRDFSFTFPTTNATTRNSFVPRLWASRRIGMLVDAIRQAGAGLDGVPRGRENIVLQDPKMRELVDEIVRLSTEFGVLSEYTAFLATEGTDLSNFNDNVTAAGENLDRRAVRTRWGKAAVNQSLNNWHAKSQKGLNLKNGYLDAEMNERQVEGVRQVSDRAYFKRGANWVDSRLASQVKEPKADRVVEYGSEEHFKLVRALAVHGRQASVALPGNILLEHEGKTVLIKNPERAW
ncbi:MAG: hypothetical protein ACYTDX_04340, partial [Planctomycetota bacterium]